MPDEEKGFVIKDRRMFSEDDQESKETEAEAKTEETEQPEAQADEVDQQASEAAEQAPDDEAPLPEVNFSTFVISLNASALVHLGAIEDPASGEKTKNLPMAKQTIDMLSMLQEKTQGNLANDEENILKSVLYDLRILYVKEKE
jgi:hypothetical protein